MSNSVTIAFDLHGTYDSDKPMFNRLIAKYLRQEHVNVYIFSGSPVEDIKNDVVQSFLSSSVDDDIVDLSYKLKFLSVVDECFKLGYPMQQREKMHPGGRITMNWYINGPDEMWWPTKAMLCQMNKINFLVDDKPEYARYFGCGHVTTFIGYTNGLNVIGTTSINYGRGVCVDYRHGSLEELLDDYITWELLAPLHE